ncbi:MAG: M20 aminoacylase family protein [Alphaproteobacteria bacterium]
MRIEYDHHELGHHLGNVDLDESAFTHMNIDARISAIHSEFAAIRRDIHANPEPGFKEIRTADLVAKRLEVAGISIHRGLGKTGVVGTLKCGESGRVIGLRADMDCLVMDELNTFDHKSTVKGCMHACGHDGHTAMLLGAARHLAETRNFDGTVHFIFQPAEENRGGGRVMIEDGLFDLFPVDAVYGMHNMPGYPTGQFAIVPGPMMASSDSFYVTIQGVGGHGAMPHMAVDPVLVAAEIVTALQSIVSRTINPFDAVVIGVSQIHAGSANNIIPDEAKLSGTVRTFNTAMQDHVEVRMRHIIDGVCQAYGAKADFIFEGGYPPTVNHEDETKIAASVAADLVGKENVVPNGLPMLGGEDFSFMLLEKPGAYIFIGNGDGEGGCMVHNPHYDFNDEIIPLGIAYWTKLIETTLSIS